MRKKDSPEVSVVLLSYNRPRCLEESLASLIHQSYENVEIAVVDNPSSSSDEVSSIVSRHANVRLIQNPTNLGYTGGMNRGINEATGEFVFLTEDDIVLDKDCINRLVNYLDEVSSVDLVAPVLYNRTARTIRCAGGEFSLGGVYRMKIYGAGEIDNGQFPVPFEVKYIDGATMLARRAFWNRFAGFREEYFMYGDSLELCARVLRSGRKMAIVPKAKAYHFEPEETSLIPEIEFHKLKNFFSLYLLHAPARYLPEFFVRYGIVNPIQSCLRKERIPTGSLLRALTWVGRKTPSLIRERYDQKRQSNPL
jgi:GT2 family glycosyltransferase